MDRKYDSDDKSAKKKLQSQAFRVNNDIANNTKVDSKQKSGQWFWRYKNLIKEKAMLSNFKNHIM
jgi:hypothetical protein